MDPSKSVLKFKKFSYYEDRYLRKLREPHCVVEPLINLCGGYYLETFKQIINQLSNNKTSPLPLFFPTIDSMDLIAKNRVLRQEIFNVFDTRQIQRIDACQLYCAMLVLTKGSYEIFLKTIASGRITRDQFFYFLDSFFRAIPKIVILKGYEKAIEPNIRIQYTDIENFVKQIFGDKNEIQRNQIYENFVNATKLSEFVKYIQKKCTNAAEISRNSVIDKVTLDAEVRDCLRRILEQVQHQLRKNIQYQKILD